jgi:fatty-acyl-CoA synthase
MTLKTSSDITMSVPCLGDLLIRKAQNYCDNEALVFDQTRITYTQLCDRAIMRAKAMLALDIQPGDKVALLMPSCPDFVEFMFATTLIGATVVPINARFQIEELTYVIGNAEIKMLVTTDIIGDYVDFSQRIKATIPDLAKAKDVTNLSLSAFPYLKNIILMNSQPSAGFLCESEFEEYSKNIKEDRIHFLRSNVKLSDIALMLYTSGTTSNPKGCPITHEAIVRNSTNLGQNRYLLTEQDKLWSPLPLFHIAAIMPLIAILDTGGSYFSSSYFQADNALKLLEEEEITVAYPCFVTIISDLINHPDFHKRDFSKIRLMNSNLAVQPKSFAKSVLEAMPHTIHVGSFGMTEASGTVCTHELTASKEQQVNNLGKPLAGMQVLVRDPQTGEELPHGETGEITVAGYGLCQGYFKDEEKSKQCFKDGWFYTGDTGFIDEHNQIMFVGRLKDMLKVGGENVAASEIESFINSHPAINLVQVVPFPDNRMSEVPVAFIELKKDMSLTEEEVINYCKGKIASFKIPKYVRFIKAWPGSATKIQKFKLIELLNNEFN